MFLLLVIAVISVTVSIVSIFVVNPFQMYYTEIESSWPERTKYTLCHWYHFPFVVDSNSNQRPIDSCDILGCLDALVVLLWDRAPDKS